MKISRLHLQNFKRFTDLTIQEIPDSSRLVLLIGSNGSGKSCIFDSFNFLNSAIKRDVATNIQFFEYYRKSHSSPVSVSLTIDGNESTVSDGDFKKLNLGEHTFYGRTSFRQIPRLTRNSLGIEKFDFEKDADRPKFFIDRDNRFENDIEKITEIILKDFFRSKKSNEQIRQKYIEPLNIALEKIFRNQNGNKLELIEIIPPLEGNVAQINFKKGTSEIHYNYLSAGEKEVFNLLINLLSRSSLYQNSIYFLDEIDLHLNTKIQHNLIQEITENWIPENCQLWTASHSLGFIEYAKKSELASIIDFDDFDFDVPRILFPTVKDNPEVYEIAVGKEFLPSLFRSLEVCFVENSDKEFFAAIGLENTVFVSENNRNSVYHKVRTTNYKGIVDRDFLSDDDIIQIEKEYPNLFVLQYYSIENYLYHPDNLEEYYQDRKLIFDKKNYVNQILIEKNKISYDIIPGLSLKRTEYPYFGEPKFNGKNLQNRFKNKKENEEQSKIIAKNLSSEDFETFYKSLPMKSFCTNIKERQNIRPSDLAKTKWFKNQIKALLESKATAPVS